MLRTGRLHLTRSIELYRAQMRNGLYFLHEYPSGSTSPLEPELPDLLSDRRVFRVKGPMCTWGMVATDSQGEGLVKKETYWVTNSRFIAAELEQECTDKTGERPWHRHVHFINHKAHAARIYPPALVAAILRGLREQLRSTGEMMEFNYPVPEDPVIPRDIPQEAEEELESYWDDANWGWLDPKLVRAARAEELAAIKSYEVYVKRPIKECL